MKPYVIGIDPGLTGALAYFKDGELIGVRDMPVMSQVVGKGMTIDCIELAKLLRPFSDHTEVVIIEKVQAMPTDGATGAFKFGKTAMAPEALCYAFALPIHFVTPGAWKSKAKLIKKDKGSSRAMAKTMWPHLADDFRLVKHDGRAEAALIAHFGLQIKEGTKNV
jgi:crossover junction endodeoxyribonuclease RuvC